MSVVADLFKIIGLILVVIALLPILLTILAYFGYFYGIILSWMAGGVLSGSGFFIDSHEIPKVIAWGFVGFGVFGMLVGMFAGSGEEEE